MAPENFHWRSAATMGAVRERTKKQTIPCELGNDVVDDYLPLLVLKARTINR
jgi:hypothetical protein